MKPALTAAWLAALALALPGSAGAQAVGAIEGQVHDAVTHRGIANVLVTIDRGAQGATTDTAGFYRIRGVRSGGHVVHARMIGYGPQDRDSVSVYAGQTARADFALSRRTVSLSEITVTTADPVLDPLATATEQRVSAADLRELPVSSLEEALALSAGAVGTSYRGGRIGEESFIIDGLGVKNQVDASTGAVGFTIPPDMLTEASLVTNGFSARYGQAVSGMINVVTKDGGDRWTGHAAYESDGPLGGSLDHGVDRFVLSGDGPLGPARFAGVIDATGRLDTDPVDAPLPQDSLDPRTRHNVVLPHSRGSQYTAAGKITLPLGNWATARLFGLHSVDQRLLFDPAFTYDTTPGLGQRVAGTLLSLQFEHASSPRASLPLVADLRLGYFDREFVRGTLTDPAGSPLSTLFHPFHITGEEIARAQDTAAAREPIPGMKYPEESELTPWGVGAFFLADGSAHGEVGWNRFRELRGQLDLTIGAGPHADLYVGGEAIQQRAQIFERALGFLPVGDSVPPATASNFTPLALAGYFEAQLHTGDLAFTGGVRYDQFDARLDLGGKAAATQRHLNPRVAVSTVLSGATLVASLGSFSQPPDYQYLVDASFDDTTRTGRFRRGNPSLGFEDAWQYELSLRRRLTSSLSFKLNLFQKRLDGLVASVPLGDDPDSSVFGNADAGTVRGLEFLLTRELRGGLGFRVIYSYQRATAHATSAFLRRRFRYVDEVTHDTITPPRVEFPLDYDRRHTLTLIGQAQFSPHAWAPLARVEAAVIGRYLSGLPYTSSDSSTGTFFGAINGARLPSTSTIDMLIRRPFRIGGMDASVYLDVRNLLGRRNIIAVRPETGTPYAADSVVHRMAEQAYRADQINDAVPPPAIPYESARYREYADLNHDGQIAGRDELFPLYLAAAADYLQPIFDYGPPRLVRLGVDLRF